MNSRENRMHIVEMDIVKDTIIGIIRTRNNVASKWMILILYYTETKNNSEES